MRLPAPLAAAAMAALVPTPAAACGGGPGFAYVHTSLPGSIPADAIVAEIEFAIDLPLDRRGGMRARVRRMIQGDYGGDTLIVRWRTWTSCDLPLGNGPSGFLVGMPYGMENGELVVDPIRADRSSVRRLLDPIRLPGQEDTVAPTRSLVSPR